MTSLGSGQNPEFVLRVVCMPHFVFVVPTKTKWHVRNRLDSGSPGGARGSVTRGDSTAYGGPCRPMLPPLGLVEAMPTDDWLGRAVCGSWSALLAP